ncbi:hypothetical protein M758_1G200500 [Ceratodon purpureus]|nr:hypothetical protein M758_1G200500 [Ceratodon purpureus]
MGLQWFCSMCRKPDVKVSVAALTAPESHVSDVSLFVEELNLDQEAEEMGAVANTFRGVESLDGASNWEGLYFQPAKSQLQKNWKRVKPVEIYEDDFPRRAGAGEKDFNRSSDVGQRRFGSQPKHFLSSLWGRWYQKPSNKDVVELMEFARGPGNEENVPPRS